MKPKPVVRYMDKNTEIIRFLNAKRFLNDLKRHSLEMSTKRFNELKEMAINGELERAEIELAEIIRA